MKVKTLIHDAKLGKSEIKEIERELPEPEPIKYSVDLRDVSKLMQYAKKQGWIK